MTQDGSTEAVSRSDREQVLPENGSDTTPSATCPACQQATFCHDCILLGELAFLGGYITKNSVTAMRHVMERRGFPEDTEESVQAFVNDVRRCYNGLCR